MDRATRSPSRQHRLVGSALIVLGAVFTLVELSKALYVLAGTLLVVAVVWPMLRAKVRSSSRVRKQITLAAAVAIGFWICTTTALRFADSGDTGGGNGAVSLVSVNPWGGEMSARDLMIHGVGSTIALAVLAQGLLLVVKMESRRRRRSSRSSPKDSASDLATQAVGLGDSP
jgi:hypothetical protein